MINELKINRAMDFLFTDTFAFAVNATLGAVVRTKLCNYSWEEKIDSDRPTEEISDRQLREKNY